MIPEYDVTVCYRDGEEETVAANELTLMEVIHQCLVRPSVKSFEVIRKD